MFVLLLKSPKHKPEPKRKARPRDCLKTYTKHACPIHHKNDPIDIAIDYEYDNPTGIASGTTNGLPPNWNLDRVEGTDYLMNDVSKVRRIISRGENIFGQTMTNKYISHSSLTKDKYIHKLQAMDFGSVLGVVLLFLISGYRCDKLEEENPVPIPYSFSYTAGRMPGHTDRVHAETSDGVGVIRGMFSYIDPRYKIRTVEYVADQNGFHPVLITNPVTDTNAVAKAKEKHQMLYNQIASEHQQIALERGQTGEEGEGQYNEEIYAPNPNFVVNHPRDTPTVEHAKSKHFNLYQKIAEEHARIAEERKLGAPEGVVINYRY